MPIPKTHYQWDAYSDQPAVIRDPEIRKQLRKKGALGQIKALLSTLLLIPFGPALALSSRTMMGDKIDSIGLAVNVEQDVDNKKALDVDIITAMIDELKVRRLLIRIPLSDSNNFERYIKFIRRFQHLDLLICILQDRENIEDHALLKNNFRALFTALNGIAATFQIGNAINRRKWAFLSLDEYFRFYRVAATLRDHEFPQLKLLGASVIDFELPSFIRALFNAFPIRYDGIASLLYVDRRGAPENTQLGCDLIAKISWFDTLIRFSKHRVLQRQTKTKSEQKKLWITETNWPLSGTEPFAPAVGDCMTSEALQKTFLVRYYLMVFASGRVIACFWHQLVAPGYGLIDNRNTHSTQSVSAQDYRIRPAFYSLKVLIELFDQAETLVYVDGQSDFFMLKVKNSKGVVHALWTNGTSKSILAEQLSERFNIDFSNTQIIDILGVAIEPQNDGTITLSDQVIYLLDYVRQSPAADKNHQQ